MPDRTQKIRFGEMRGSGVRDVLIYCSDYKCSHHTKVSGDAWPDHVRLSDIEPGFVCTACGRRGADVRDDFRFRRHAGHGPARPWVANDNMRIGQHFKASSGPMQLRLFWRYRRVNRGSLRALHGAGRRL
jgi:hypothetical protein